MSTTEWAATRAALLAAPMREDIAARDAADLAAARARHPAAAKAYDDAIRAAAVEHHRSLVRRVVAAELDLRDAAGLHSAALAAPSELDRQRAADRLAAAASLRDTLTLAVETAHAAAYPNPTGA